MPPSTCPGDAAAATTGSALDDDVSAKTDWSEAQNDGSDALAMLFTETDKLVGRLLGADIAHDTPALESPVAEACASVGEARMCTTSIMVFKRHVFAVKRKGDGAAQDDGVISRECYEDWLFTRSRIPADPEKTYQRILACTIAGTDGRQPFTPDEEATALKQLRVKRVWPAFAGTGLAIGTKGFRGCVPGLLSARALTRSHVHSLGFHEKARLR